LRRDFLFNAAAARRQLIAGHPLAADTGEDRLFDAVGHGFDLRAFYLP
jgi:hypothetical protein